VLPELHEAHLLPQPQRPHPLADSVGLQSVVNVSDSMFRSDLSGSQVAPQL